MGLIGKAIATRVISALAMVLVAAFLLGGTAVYRFGAANDRAAGAGENWLAGVSIDGQMETALTELRSKVSRLVVTGNTAQLDDAEKLLASARDTVNKTRDFYRSMVVKGTPDEKHFTEFDAAYAQWMKSVDHVDEMVRKGDRKAGAYFNSEDRALFNAALVASRNLDRIR